MLQDSGTEQVQVAGWAEAPGNTGEEAPSVGSTSEAVSRMLQQHRPTKSSEYEYEYE